MPMSGETEKAVSGWTVDTWAAHTDALRLAEDRFQAERDRRYTEVNIEREKALKIKEEADKVALDLARQIQTYKDEQANELREQINSERGIYATKDDVAAVAKEFATVMKPALEFVASQRGGSNVIDRGWAALLAVAALAVAVYAAVGK